MKTDALMEIRSQSDSATKTPVLFLGHDSLMNAIEENEFVDGKLFNDKAVAGSITMTSVKIA